MNREYRCDTGVAKPIVQYVRPNVVERVKIDVFARPFLEAGSYAHDDTHEFIHAVEALAQVHVPVRLPQFLAPVPKRCCAGENGGRVYRFSLVVHGFSYSFRALVSWDGSCGNFFL